MVIETKMCYALFMIRRWWRCLYYYHSLAIRIVLDISLFLQACSTNATPMQSRHGAGSGMIRAVPCLNLMLVL